MNIEIHSSMNRLLLLLLMTISIGASAQQLIPSVISTSGGFYSNASGSLSFTTGEMAAITTLTSPAITLSQGFQHPWDFGTYTLDIPDLDFEFTVYPNPASGMCNLLTTSDQNVDVDVYVTDLLGRQIHHSAFRQTRAEQTEALDLTYAAPGMYLLTLSLDRNGSAFAAEKTVKIEIIR
jgi:hypothetical protein